MTNNTDEFLSEITITDKLDEYLEKHFVGENAVYYRSGKAYRLKAEDKNNLVIISGLSLLPREKVIIFYSVLNNE